MSMFDHRGNAHDASLAIASCAAFIPQKVGPHNRGFGAFCGARRQQKQWPDAEGYVRSP